MEATKLQSASTYILCYRFCTFCLSPYLGGWFRWWGANTGYHASLYEWWICSQRWQWRLLINSVYLLDLLVPRLDIGSRYHDLYLGIWYQQERHLCQFAPHQQHLPRLPSSIRASLDWSNHYHTHDFFPSNSLLLHAHWSSDLHDKPQILAICHIVALMT